MGLESSGEPLPPQLQPKNSSKRLPTHSEGKFCTFLKEKIHFLLTCLGEYFERVLVGCSPGLETSVCSKKPAQRRPLQAMAGKWRILAAEARICHGLAFCRFFVTFFLHIANPRLSIQHFQFDISNPTAPTHIAKPVLLIHPCQPLIPNLTFLIQEFWPDA